MKMEKKKSVIRIGELLRKTRKSLGYTQEEVAEMLDLASRYISDIERNKTKGSVDTFILQDYLDISEDFKIDPNLIGFYDLNEHDKQVVIELIQYMNKKDK